MKGFKFLSFRWPFLIVLWVVIYNSDICFSFLCPGTEHCQCYKAVPMYAGYNIRCQPFINISELTNFFQKFPRFRPVKELTLKGCGLNTLPNKAFDNVSVWSLETDCPFRVIEDGALDEVNGLQKLSMTNTLFRELPKTVCKTQELKSLILRNGQLDTLGEEACTFSSLTYISFGNCKLVNLTKIFFYNLTKLQGINVEYNNLSLIEEGAFDQTRQLSTINFRENELRSVDGLFQYLNPGVINLYSNNLSNASDIFHKGMWKLQTITLGKNPIGSLPATTFANKTPNVQHLDLSFTKHTKLDPLELRSMQGLTSVNLQHNSINHIPDGYFEGLQSLQTIDIRSSNVQTAPRVFVDLPSLETLLLSRNMFRDLGKVALSNLPKLTGLYLSSNRLARIGSGHLDGVPGIETLYLSSNHLMYIDSGAFSKLQNLRILDLSYNNFYQFNFSIQNLESLENLRAHSGRLREIKYDEMIGLPRLRLVNLESNEITTLNANFRSLVKLKSINIAQNRIQTLARNILPDGITEFQMEDNPWICDCRLRWLVKWLVETNGTYLLDNPTCTSPEKFANKPLRNLTEEDMIWWKEDCPYPCNCSCEARGNDFLLVANCSHEGLTEIPETIPPHLGGLELDNNALVNVTSLERKDFSELQELNLRKNSISDFEIPLPQTLHSLLLDGNKLNRVSYTLLDVDHLTFVTLGENPWICDCGTKAFKAWLNRNRKAVQDVGDVRCGSGHLSGKLIVDLSDADLCSTGSPFGIELDIILIACGFAVVAILGLAVCVCCSFGSKAFLFCIGCTWVKKEDVEEDEEKPYDAFLFYTPEDRAFAVEQIARGLETNPPKFSLCIPSFVSNQSLGVSSRWHETIRMCRRSIAIVSRDFLNNPTCMDLLRIVFSEFLCDTCPRLIVIQYGELPPMRELDTTVKLALKQKTHVIWGSCLFWPKLRFLMPKTIDSPRREFHEMNDGDDTEPILA